MAIPLLGVVSIVELLFDSVIAFTTFAILGILLLAALIWSVLVIIGEVSKVRRRRRELKFDRR